MLAVYLPQRALLQETAQYAANNIAIDLADTGLVMADDGTIEREDYYGGVFDVYVDAISGMWISEHEQNLYEEKLTELVKSKIDNGIVKTSSDPNDLTVTINATNYVIYQSVSVIVTQNVKLPMGLEFIGFPETIVMTQEAQAVVLNGDEFTRNIDLATDFASWLAKKIDKKLSESGIGDSYKKVKEFFNW
jgi:hypothetical protein